MVRSRGDLTHAAAAQAKVEQLLAGNEIVNGVGLGREADGFVIRVFVVTPGHRLPVPDEMDGFPIHVQPIGDVRPF